jgi:hypothetical protein
MTMTFDQKISSGSIITEQIPRAVRGCSTTGQQKIVFTDGPGIFLHDSGGLVSEPRYWILEGSLLVLGQTCNPVWVGSPPSLQIDLAFSPLVSVQVEVSGAAAELVVRQILERIFPPQVEMPFTGPSLHELRCVFAPEAAARRSAILASRDLHPNLRDLMETGKTSVHVRISGGRMCLRRYDTAPLFDLPLKTLGLQREGETGLAITGRPLVCGQPVESLHLCLQTSGSIDAILAAAGPVVASSPGDRTFAGTVRITGSLGGRAVDAIPFDIVVGPGWLELHDPATSNCLHRFDLASPSLAIEGRSDAFLLADDTFGPLRIEVPSPAFAQVMQSHRALAAAARRSMEVGPYVASSTEGFPQKIRVGSKGIEVMSPWSSHSIAHDRVDSIGTIHSIDETSVMTIEIREEQSPLRLHARTPTLEGIHAAVQTYRVFGGAARDPARFARALLELERDWFLHVVFTPFIGFEEALAVRRNSAHVTAAGDTDGISDPAEVVKLFSDAVPLLREHLDAVTGSLAQHVMVGDRRLFTRAKLAWPDGLSSVQELHMRAFASLVPLTGQVARLERELPRGAQRSGALAGSSKTVAGLGAAASLGLGLLTLNPMAMISGAAQAGRLVTGGSQRRTDDEQRQRGLALSLVTTWDYLLRTMVPMVAPRFESLILEPRSRLSETFLKVAGSKPGPHAITSLAHRSAKLEAFRIFPETGAGTRPRRISLDLLAGLRRDAATARFSSF